ncbi:MAG: hypothetical protein SH819_01515 [Cytophagales bacterium]|nr:hypothetical protein [Cytophagales bacterium]
MERFFFEEKQRLPRLLVWVVLFACLALTGCAWWILEYHGEFSTSTSAGKLVLMMLPAGVLVWLTAVFRLEVTVTAKALEYRYYPHQWKSRKIEKDAIAGYQFRRITFGEFVQARRDRRLGRFRRSQGLQVLAAWGTDAMELTLQSGQKILLGTQDTTSMTWAMKKLMENVE